MKLIDVIKTASPLVGYAAEAVSKQVAKATETKAKKEELSNSIDKVSFPEKS